MASRATKQAQEKHLPKSESTQQPFGTQSLWSTLLVEREHLESEIKHAKIFLEQLRKDVVITQRQKYLHLPPEGGVPSARGTPPSGGSRPQSVQSPAFQSNTCSGKNLPAAVRSALDKHSLEQSVLMWLDGLRARLDHITVEAEKLLAEGEQQSESPDESLFTLLRGAG